MKKNLFLIGLVVILTAGIAKADGMVFDPSEFKADLVKPTATESTAKTEALLNRDIETNIKEASTYSKNAVSGQSTNFNNALYELDSAQVNLRNDLLEYKAKYQEVDTQYHLVKEQRRVLNQQVKDLERKIKNIENSKSNIRKTMQ